MEETALVALGLPHRRRAAGGRPVLGESVRFLKWPCIKVAGGGMFCQEIEG